MSYAAKGSKVVLAALLFAMSCPTTVTHTTTSRTYRCEKDGGCTVVVNGTTTYYSPGGYVPVACGYGVVVVGGCGCGVLPPAVVAGCGCGPVVVAACAGCGSSCGSCGGCGSCGSGG